MMLCEIGNFLIFLALLLLPFQALGSFLNHFLVSRIRTVHFAAIAFAYGILVFGFLIHDTGILGVLLYSSPDHPFYYRIGSTWSYHQGSMLLWMFLMSLVALKLPLRALSVFSFFQMYFLCLLYFKASPFIEVPAGDFLSRGINPLLEDTALLYHPPILYMGYILNFACWSLICSFLLRKKDISLLKTKDLKPWILGSWIALSVGLTSGSFWAFYEVGWGGWWFWDPVENIALIPWLLLLGALHLLNSERPSFHLKLLVFLSFSFTFLGVFIVRMGIIRSIHNFTQTFDNIIFVKIGICFIIASIFFLFRNQEPLKHVLRRKETNIPGLLGVSISLLIGIATFLPLFLRVEVGPNFYKQVIVPLCMLYPITLMFSLSFQQLKITTVVGLIVIMLLYFIEKQEWILFFLLLTFSLNLGFALWKTPQSKSANLSHTGLLIFLMGVSFNHFLGSEKEIALKIGDSGVFMGKEIKIESVKIIQTPIYKGEIAKLKWGDATLFPERRYYQNYNSIRPKVSFSLGIFTTYYAYITDRIEKNDEQQWVIHLQSHPLISWIWLGGILMALGGMFSFFKKKLRILSDGNDKIVIDV